MAIVDQIQDENNVTKDIADKALNGKGTKTAVADTDYVLLEDTSGAYHKILKSSFTDAIRAAMGGSIAGVTIENSAITKVPVLGASSLLGSMTPANLASVLGASYTTINSGSLNNVKTPGLYLVFGSDVSDSPLTTVKRGILRVYKVKDVGNVAFYAQEYTETINKTNQVFTRAYDGRWSSWVRMDNFGCSSASDLAALLGVDFTYKENIQPEISLDTLTSTGYYFLTARPSDTVAETGGLLFSVNFGNLRTLHVLFPFNEASISFRVYYTNNQTWTEWNTIQ